MKVREVITIALVFFAGYSVMKDIFFNSPTCYYEETLENGNVLGSWSSDNCKIKTITPDLSAESETYLPLGTKSTSYSVEAYPVFNKSYPI